MFVATGYDLLKTLKPGPDETALTPVAMNAHQWITLAIGFVVSFFVAWGVVAWFMGWVRKRGFVPFAIYRIILGLVILICLR
jgi:undecaprenyl-diphosphatase